MTISEHYNEGMQMNVIACPFRWDVIPVYFKWFENGSKAYELRGFSSYPIYHDPANRPWGGKKVMDVTFYLPGNYHGAEIHSLYYSDETLPLAWGYTLQYGQLNSSSGFLQENVVLSVEGTSPLLSLSDSIVQKVKGINGDAVEVSVNGVPISQRHVEALVQLKCAYGKEISRENVLEKLILDELYFQEAVKRDLQVTRDFAEAFAHQTRIDLETAENRGEIELLVKTLSAAFEMTEQEYWEWAVIEYEKLLSAANLRASFVDKEGTFNAEEYGLLGTSLYGGAELGLYSP